MCSLPQQPGMSRYILLRDLPTGLCPILESVHWAGWVPDVNSIQLFVHDMRALPNGHPRRAIPEVDHGSCVQMLVPTVRNVSGACVWHDLMGHEAAAAAPHLQPSLDQKER